MSPSRPPVTSRTAKVSKKALTTQRIWSRLACSESSMVGIATLTIVASSRTTKKPRHRTSSASHGFRLCSTDYLQRAPGAGTAPHDTRGGGTLHYARDFTRGDLRSARRLGTDRADAPALNLCSSTHRRCPLPPRLHGYETLLPS